jgi:hypothetical protein
VLIPNPLYKRMQELKVSLNAESRDGMPMPIGAMPFLFCAKGTRNAPYRFTNADAVVAVGYDRPHVRIEFPGAACTAHSLADLLLISDAIFAAFGEAEVTIVSRVDLAIDTTGLESTTSDRDNFVARAKHGQDFVQVDTNWVPGTQEAVLTCFRFSPGNTLPARLDNKTRELQRTTPDADKHRIQTERWAAKCWDKPSDVWRLEAQLQGAALMNFACAAHLLWTNGSMRHGRPLHENGFASCYPGRHPKASRDHRSPVGGLPTGIVLHEGSGGG